MTKALAALMVVTAHLLRQGAAADYLAAVSVSVFFVLAGITAHAHTDVRSWLSRLARRVVVPYLLVGIVSIMAYRILGSYAAASLGVSLEATTLPEDLLHLFYGSSVGGRMKWNESLWYLPCYVLVMLMTEGIEHVGEQHRIIRGVLYAAGGILGYVLITTGMAGLPWQLETALYVLPLCGIGRYLRDGLRGRRMSPVLCLVIAAGLICYSVSDYPGLLQTAGGTLSLRAPRLGDDTYAFLVFSSIGVFYLVWAISRLVSWPEWIAAAGTHSLDVLLWNKFPVLACQILLPLVIPGFADLYVGGNTPDACLLAVLLAVPCMALCCAWAWLLHRLYEARQV